MKNKSFNNIQDNYRLILNSLTGLEDVSEYTFTNIEDEIDKFINLLEESDQMIITKRFGLDDGIPKTLDYLSQNLTFNGKRYTRERIRKVCNDAINNLRELIHLNSKTTILTKESFIYNEEKITHKMLGSLNFSEACDATTNIPNYKSKRTLFFLALYDKLINQKITDSNQKSHKLK